MGQAFDRDGHVLGEAYGETKREVFDKLTKEFADAHEIRIKTIDAHLGASPERAQGDGDSRPLDAVGVVDEPMRGTSGDDPPGRLTFGNVDHAFTYQPWNGDQIQRGREVAAALVAAAKTLLRTVPECPTRTRALNHLIDARLLANAAITHDGRV